MLTVIRIRRALALLCLGAAACAANAPAYAQSADPADQVCARYAPGSALPAPPELFSENHVLEVTLKFVTVTDAQGLQRYCYLSGAGLQTPTLHVSPGDQLIIHLQNALPAGPAPSAGRRRARPGGLLGRCDGTEHDQPAFSRHERAARVSPGRRRSAPWCRRRRRSTTSCRSRRTSPRGCTGITRIRTGSARARCSAAAPAR